MDTNLMLSSSKLANWKSIKPVRVWGIDLGTTNSTVSEISWSPDREPSSPPECRCLELEQPTTEGIFTSPIVPSVVAILPSGETWVGEGAKRLRTRPQQASLTTEKNLFFETKNEMGLRKTYYRASEDFNSASKIGGHILAFLMQEAQKLNCTTADRVVVTVPASFQLNQRRDTLWAAQKAGISLGEYDLLDEPTAALIGYLMSHSTENIFKIGPASQVLVFDFGGGTCDVSIVQIELDRQEKQLKGSMLATSRYHRLGGGDLDVAIVHEDLIPAVIEENGLFASDLTWAEKKRGLETQLLGTAEALKIALCKEIDRLKKFGKYQLSNKDNIISKQPSLECSLGKRRLVLSRPQLSALQWERLLEPFLDSEFLFARETEYRLTQSILAPVQDALDRVGLSSEDIDIVLLVGGSTLIPQVQETISTFFSKSRVFTFEDSLDTQLAVSRGAAWHAFFLQVMGRPFIQPVVNETIALLTGKDVPHTLIQTGSPVPYPADGSYARITDLVIPAALIRELKMEVITVPNHQLLFSETWKINQIVDSGDPITVEFRIGGNHEFECRSFLSNYPMEVFERTVQNPLMNVVSPDKIRVQLEELEEELRQKGGPSAADRDKLIEIARLYANLKHLERAQEYLRTALRLLNQPDAGILNLQGVYYGEMGDFGRQIKAYGEADKASPHWDGPAFNLALAYRRKGKYQEALAAVEKALTKAGNKAASQTLKALCLRSLGRTEEATELLASAKEAFGEVANLDDWALGWLETCAQQLNEKETLVNITNERKRRQGNGQTTSGSEILRPDVKGGLQKR